MAMLEVCSTVYSPTGSHQPLFTLTGAAAVLKASEHLFFRLSDRSGAFLEQWLERPPGCSPKSPTRRASGSRRRRTALKRLGPSRATPYFGIPIPDAPGNTSTVWLDAPHRLSRRAAEYLPRQGGANGERRSREFLRP